MQYWLFKSEPATWSWEDQVARGDAGEEWTGVRNYQARNMMRRMAVGDRGFFYHSQTDRAVVGIVEVIAAAHPDGTDDSGKWECVDIRALDAMPRPVTLSECKAKAELADMALVTNTRLSVQPVSPAEWDVIRVMGGL
jgi:predicted RNA-binding protein with PUA-like domain